MARRIRWQILIAVLSALLISGLMGSLALRSTAVARPAAGGSYVEAVLGRPQELNPLLIDPLNDPVAADLRSFIFEGLTRLGPDGLPEPGLASSWEVSDDGLVYTFRLRQDVRWHDQQPFDADDVLFTFQSVRARGFEGDPALATLWRNVIVERIDQYSVRFTLSAPYGPFLSSVGLPIVPEHLLGQIPVAEWRGSAFSRAPVGTGPYQLEQLDNELARLRANPDYYLGVPLLEGIELRFFDDIVQARAALERREVGGMGLIPLRTPIDLPSLPETQALALALDEYTTITFNLAQAPLNDRVLRQSLAQALDKQELIEQRLNGLAQRLDTPILPNWWAYDPEVPWYAYDPEAAARALSEIGFSPGVDGILARGSERLSFELITDGAADRVAAAEEIARQWGAIGVEIRPQSLEGAELLDRLNRRDFSIALHSLVRLGADPDNVYGLWHSSQASRGANFAGLRDSEIDQLLGFARQESRIEARRANYAAFQERWVALVPAITLYQPYYVYLCSTNLGGLGFNDPQVSGNNILYGRADRFRFAANWFLNSTQEIRGNLR